MGGLESFFDICKFLIKHWKKTLPLIVIEVLFFITFGLFTATPRDGIGQNLLHLGDSVISQANPGTPLGAFIFNSVEFSNILKLVGIVGVISYVLYGLFHGYLWRACFNLKSKKPFFPYLKKFFVINLFWIVIFSVYVLINFFFTYIDLVSERYDPSHLSLAPFTNILLFVILYFTFISYVLIEKEKVFKSFRKSFSLGIKKIKKTYPVLVFLLGFSVIYLIIGRVASVSIPFFFVLGILVIPFLMLSGRLFIKKVVDRR